MGEFTTKRNGRDSATRAFLNSEFGNALNQNVAFSGTPVVIHDGGDSSAWTGAAVAGAWDFADTTNPAAGSNCVSLTLGNDADSATFTGGASVNGANYSAISMDVRLDTFNSANHNITIQCALSGTPIGVAVNVGNYINPAVLGIYQTAAIPLSDLGVDALTFDRIVVTLSRAGGAKPTFRFDSIQVEETGGIELFLVGPDTGKIFYIDELKFVFVDNVTGNLALDYSQILGVSPSNGIIITRITRDGPVVGRKISSVYEFESFGFDVSEPQDNGTNSLISASVRFIPPLELDDSFGEYIQIEISDDLSGFLEATAIARGHQV